MTTKAVGAPASRRSTGIFRTRTRSSGYSSEFGMEHHLRISIAPTIYAGTNEIQRDVVSSTFGLLPSSR
ncbi:hypothetical protein CG716_22850 [Mycolicibacterium sphagni]|uniref:Uncharacterized protein n=1 Tax=Mycolicibacterium sphagni TaxID=1786 RepID=A0A255DAR4_9MYCO|nr:hypothetical protein CG716_22850 [Mycolicibacterium sphagni]